MICFLFIPVHWLFFAASTYVWVQYVWHTGEWPSLSPSMSPIRTIAFQPSSHFLPCLSILAIAVRMGWVAIRLTYGQTDQACYNSMTSQGAEVIRCCVTRLVGSYQSISHNRSHLSALLQDPQCQMSQIFPGLSFLFSSEKGICLPTVFLWLLFVYIEAAIRLKEYKFHFDTKNLPFHLDLCRPFAAHW